MAPTITPGDTSPMTAPAGTTQESARPRLGATLARNAFANFAGQAMILGLTIVSTPFIMHRIGAPAYGTLILVLTFVNMLTLFQLGINTSLVTFMADLFGRGQRAEAVFYLRNAISVFIVFGSVLTVVMLELAPWTIERLFHIPHELRADAQMGFYLAAGAFCVRFLTDPLTAIPIAAQRFDLVNLAAAGCEIIRISSSMIAIALGFRITGVCCAILIANTSFLLANIAMGRHLLPEMSLRPHLSRKVFSKLGHFSKFVLISNVCSRAVHELDNVIIGYFMPAGYVAYYAVPYSLAQKLWTLVGNVTSVVYPAGCTLTALETRDRFRDLYLRSSRIVAALAGCAALALCVISDQILLWWIGPEFARQGTLTMRLLCFGFLLNTLAHVPSSLSQAWGRPGIAAKFSAMNAIFTLALFSLLIPRFGIVGAAASFLATQLVLSPWLIVTTNRLVGVDWKIALTECYPRPLAVWLLTSTAFWLLRPTVSSLFSLLAASVVGGLLSLLFIWIVVLDSGERRPFLNLLPRRFRPMAAT